MKKFTIDIIEPDRELLRERAKHFELKVSELSTIDKVELLSPEDIVRMADNDSHCMSYKSQAYIYAARVILLNMRIEVKDDILG